MELIDVPPIAVNANEWVYIHLFTDLHYASINCDRKQLRTDINKLKMRIAEGEKHYWMGGGDWSNSIGPKDKRFDATAVTTEFTDLVGRHLFQAEARALAHVFKPIKEQGLCVGSGNHEEAVAKRCEYHPMEDVAERLDLPFVGYVAGLRFTLDCNQRTQTVTALWHHGRGAARTKGAKVNTLWGLREIAEANVYLTGHNHEQVDFPEVRMSLAKKGRFRLDTAPLLFVNGGTYVKTYHSPVPQEAGKFNKDEEGVARLVRNDYAELQQYRPSVIGHNGFGMRVTRSGSLYRTQLGRVEFTRW